MCIYIYIHIHIYIYIYIYIHVYYTHIYTCPKDGVGLVLRGRRFCCSLFLLLALCYVIVCFMLFEFVCCMLLLCICLMIMLLFVIIVLMLFALSSAGGVLSESVLVRRGAAKGCGDR